MSKTAVLVVDMQERYFQKGRPLNTKRDALTRSINVLLDKARKNNWVVLFVKEVFKADFSDAPKEHREFALPEVVEGNPLAEIVKEFDEYILENNVSIKKRHSAFEDTDIRQKLDQEDVSKVIITGINTDTCVLSACLGARMDYDVTIVKDCVASARDEMHDTALELLKYKADVKSLSEVVNDE